MRRGIVLVALAGLAWSGPAACGDVIVHGDLTISPEDVRDIFLGEKQLEHGVRLVPIDNGAAQQEFLAKVLQTDAQKYYARWTRKSFRDGITAPASKGTDAEVIAFVKSTPGAVGYVSRSYPGVKVISRY
jgi:ABC-type phosphate transport system substrate-binding protein